MKQFLIGCCVVVVVLIASAVIAIALLAPKFKQAIGMFEGEINKEGERQKLSNEWVPPVKDVKDATALQEIPDDTLFPGTVGNDKRTTTDEDAAIPDLSISLKGKHAQYMVGSDTMDVYVYQATEGEKQAIYNYCQGQYNQNQNRGGARRVTALGYRMYYESPEVGQNHLWGLKNGWFFVFRTKATEDKEDFVMAYLKAIDAKDRPEAEGVKPQKKDDEK